MNLTKKYLFSLVTSAAALLYAMSGSAATCDTNAISGLVAGSYPCFVTDVVFEYNVRTDNKTGAVSSLTIKAKEDPNRTASSLFRSGSGSPDDELAITGTKFDFNFGASNKVTIKGDTSVANGTLMTADLTGDWAQNGSLIGFNTTNIACDSNISAWANSCTTAEVVYFLLNGTPDLTQGTKGWVSLTGVAYTSVPVPAAVWLFGSGLVGLAGIARRRKAA